MIECERLTRVDVWNPRVLAFGAEVLHAAVEIMSRAAGFGRAGTFKNVLAPSDV